MFGFQEVRMENWYRIPDAREIGVRRSSVGRLSTFESLWEAWRDAIRVLIRVLGIGTARTAG